MRGAGTLDKSAGSKDVFFASDWKTKDQRDFDLGAVNPILVSLPGSTGPGGGDRLQGRQRLHPGHRRSGERAARHLRRDDAGDERAGCPHRLRGGLEHLLRDPRRGRVVGMPRPDHQRRRDHGVRHRAEPAAQAVGAWCASYSLVPKGIDESFRNGGPAAPGLISTSTDGSSDALVWYMDAGNQLVALDGATGAPDLPGHRRRMRQSCASGPLRSPSGAESSWPLTASSAPGLRTEAAHRPVTGVTGPRRGQRRSWLESGRPSARPSRYEIRGSCL